MKFDTVVNVCLVLTCGYGIYVMSNLQGPSKTDATKPRAIKLENPPAWHEKGSGNKIAVIVTDYECPYQYFQFANCEWKVGGGFIKGDYKRGLVPGPFSRLLGSRASRLLGSRASWVLIPSM